MREVDLIVIHCSFTKPEQDWGVNEIRRIHVEEKGWRDIGYHVVIRRDGTMEHGRDFSEPGAHARGYNKRSLGVCLIGGMSPSGQPEANFTSAQWHALAEMVKSLLGAFPGARVVGHKDLNPTKECPCFDAMAWSETIGQDQEP